MQANPSALPQHEAKKEEVKQAPPVPISADSKPASGDKRLIQRYQTDQYLMQHFKPIKVIGKGSFGEVTKAIDLRTNKIRAIKKIKKSAI